MTAGEATPWYKAVRHGDTIQVRRLLSDGADPNEPSGRFGTILWEAGARGHTPILRLLLEAGAKPTSYAVQAAAFGNHGKAVRLLLSAGAPVDAGGGQTPFLNALHWSGLSREQQEKLRHVLREAGGRELPGWLSPLALATQIWLAMAATALAVPYEATLTSVGMSDWDA